MKEELANLVRTFEALGPIVGNAVKSGQRLSLLATTPCGG